MSKWSFESALFAVVLAPVVALAAPPALPAPTQPAPEAVKATWDYFYRGKEPVLVDAKVCRRIGKIPPVQFDCETEADPAGVKAGETTWLWHAWFVPQGASAELKLQLSDGKEVRNTTFKVMGRTGDPWRSRGWQPLQLDKPGTWTITVSSGDKVLKSLEVKVL